MNFGILLGMIVGDTFYIDDDIKTSFKDSGISHLVAVSGTNITYVILATKFILDRLVR
jgi:competence protein ComEC